MNQRNPLYRKFSYYCVLPILVFLIFKKTIEGVIIDFFVKPLFSNCYPPNLTYDITIVLLIILLTFPVLYKSYKGARIPTTWNFVFLSYVLIYLQYRITNSPFSFTAFSLLPSIKLLDIISSIPLVFILSNFIFHRVETIKKTEDINGFSVDEAIKIDETSDLLNRTKFSRELANRIKNTSSVNGSFPIGLVAAWGAGKTTFLNTLLAEFQGKEFITIELNVWKCSSSDQIIVTLFKQLKDKLKEFSFTIDNKLQNYASSLVKGTQNEGLFSIKSLSEIFIPNPAIEKQYDTINEEIRRINKKILILIDDLDRLDKKEIYEVIRLIRNTANFSNTFFIVAYDRNYILNAIEEINAYQSHLFLEKIFQLEFTLAPIEKSILWSEIRKRLNTVLTATGKLELKRLIEPHNEPYGEKKANLTNYFISNMRDVTRFVNSFIINYQFVKDEVDLVDFYNLELIRFKHPEVFLEIFRNNRLFFQAGNRQNYYPPDPFTYALAMHEDEITKQKRPTLELFLKTRHSVYKLTDTEIELIIKALNIIFPQHNAMYGGYRSTINSHLTVIKPSMFDRYYRLGIEGNLSNIEFSKMRQCPSSEFHDWIAKMCTTQAMAEELAERFEDVADFDDRNDFEKVVRAIFHFADFCYKKRSNQKEIVRLHYNESRIAAIIGRDKNIAVYYNSDKQDYKKFLLSLLTTNSDIYEYKNDFINSLLHREYYSISNIFSKEEIEELLLENFKKAVHLSDSTANLLWFYFRCESRIEKPSTGNTISISYPIQKVATHLIRRFIFEKDLDGFLCILIKEVPFSDKKRLSMNDYASRIFKNNTLFIWLVGRYKKPSKYKEEFLSFYNTITLGSGETDAVSKDFFKVIPVLKWRDDEE